MLDRRVIQPLLKVDRAEARVIGRNERALVEFGAEVPRAGIDDNLARVVARAEALTDEVGEAKLFGTRHLDRAVHWRAHGDPPDRARDLISRHRLNKRGWQPNRRAISRFVGDALHELEELRRVN